MDARKSVLLWHNRRTMHIVLFQPEIPGNTGNIIRLCANTGADLHLIEPLGFLMQDARLRRAGLDYHEWARVRRWPDLDHCLSELSGRVTALTTSGETWRGEALAGADDIWLFGPETRGLPHEVLAHPRIERRLRWPMRPGSRSLNLSNAVAVVVYEAWRQQGFTGAV